MNTFPLEFLVEELRREGVCKGVADKSVGFHVVAFNHYFSVRYMSWSIRFIFIFISSSFTVFKPYFSARYMVAIPRVKRLSRIAQNPFLLKIAIISLPCGNRATEFGR